MQVGVFIKFDLYIVIIGVFLIARRFNIPVYEIKMKENELLYLRSIILFPFSFFSDQFFYSLFIQDFCDRWLRTYCMYRNQYRRAVKKRRREQKRKNKIL